MHKYFENIHFENECDSNDVATSRSLTAKTNLLETCSSTSSLNSSYFNSSVNQNSSNFPSNPILSKSSKSSKGLSLVESCSSSLSSSSVYLESIEPDSSDLPLYKFTSITDTISTSYTNPNSSWFGDQSSRSTIKAHLPHFSTISERSTSRSSLRELEHPRNKIKYKKSGVNNMSSNCNLKSVDPVRNMYRIAEPHIVQLDSGLHSKQVYRSDSIEFLTPFAARIVKYQQQLKKHESFCPLFRKEYEVNFVIGDHISQMEKILTNKKEKNLSTGTRKGKGKGTPDRAKELVEKYFNS